MVAWIGVSAKICLLLSGELKIVRPAHKNLIILPAERSIINEDVCLHLENVTLDCTDGFLKDLLAIIAAEKFVDVRTAVYADSPEINKLTVVLHNFKNLKITRASARILKVTSNS